MIIRLSIIFIGLAVLLFIFAACEKPEAPSLYDYDYQSPRPQPQITNVDPPEWWFAGIGVLTLTGSNFSPNIGENFVYFNTTRAIVLSATLTQLQVRPPNVLGDDIKIRVSVFGAEEFSAPVSYRLEPAVEEWGGLSDNQRPGAIAVDKDDNVYVGVYLSAENTTAGVLKITPDKVITAYNNPTPNHLRTYSGMKFGPDGSLYTVQGINLITRVQPGGGPEENWLPLTPRTRRGSDLDFDEHGYMWVVGNNPAIIRVAPVDRSVVEFDFQADSRSVRYYNGYLYVSARIGTSSEVWRFPVDSQGNLGTGEKYFDFTAEVGSPTAEIFALTFSSEGVMYLGTNTVDAIILVYPDKSWEPLYQGLMRPRSMVFAWNSGPDLFVFREAHLGSTSRLMRVNTLKERAPYYGLGN